MKRLLKSTLLGMAILFSISALSAGSKKGSMKEQSFIKGKSMKLPPFKDLIVGLGWSPMEGHGKFDLDATVTVLDEEGNIIFEVYFNQKCWEINGKTLIKSMGDERTGESKGDHEVLKIDLEDINKYCPKARKLIVAVTSYNGQEFDYIPHSFARIARKDHDNELRMAIFRLNSGKFTGKRSMIPFSIIKNEDGTWAVKAVGEGVDCQPTEEGKYYVGGIQKSIQAMNDGGYFD